MLPAAVFGRVLPVGYQLGGRDGLGAPWVEARRLPVFVRHGRRSLLDDIYFFGFLNLMNWLAAARGIDFLKLTTKFEYLNRQEPQVQKSSLKYAVSVVMIRFIIINDHSRRVAEK